MSTPQLFVPLNDADALVQKLVALGNSLKPIDDANYYFFEIVRELVDATIKNFNELRRGYVAGNLNLTAWVSRNLLELTVFTKYVLKSGAYARRFGDDRLIDGCELIIALRDLERFYDPSAPTPGLDDALKRMEDQKAEENVTGTRQSRDKCPCQRSGNGAGVSINEPSVFEARSSHGVVHARRERRQEQLPGS